VSPTDADHQGIEL
jgi:hypothetical protein